MIRLNLRLQGAQTGEDPVSRTYGEVAMRKTVLQSAMLFVLLFCFQTATSAQGPMMGSPRLKGEFKPVLGAWAQYRLKGGDMPSSTMKIAIVGKEGSYYWYETITEQGGETTIAKMLVSGDPGNSKAVKRFIVKNGGEPAMEMPVTESAKPAGPREAPCTMVDKGNETVSVPAGTFRARHLQFTCGNERGDTWASEKVPPYGIVKSTTRGMEMILTGYGMGAKTAITETPRKFTMPPMPKGMPKGMMPPGMVPPGD